MIPKIFQTSVESFLEKEAKFSLVDVQLIEQRYLAQDSVKIAKLSISSSSAGLS